MFEKKNVAAPQLEVAHILSLTQTSLSAYLHVKEVDLLATRFLNFAL